MKSREEFIDSVWKKSQIVLETEEEACKWRSQRYRLLMSFGRHAAVVSACMILGAGLLSSAFDNVDKLAEYNSESDINSKYDLEKDSEKNSADKISNDDGAETSGDCFMEKEAPSDSKCNAGKAGDEQISAYYALPVAVEICEIQNEGIDSYNSRRITGDSVIDAVEWFYGLDDELVYTQEEYEKLNKEIIKGKIYKFTMDCSDGDDSEGVDRIYYLLMSGMPPEF